MIDLTDKEKQLLIQLLTTTPFQGNFEQLKETMKTIDGLLDKLREENEPKH